MNWLLAKTHGSFGSTSDWRLLSTHSAVSCFSPQLRSQGETENGTPSFSVRERQRVGHPAGHPGCASKLSSSEERDLVNSLMSTRSEKIEGFKPLGISSMPAALVIKSFWLQNYHSFDSHTTNQDFGNIRCRVILQGTVSNGMQSLWKKRCLGVASGTEASRIPKGVTHSHN